LASVRRPDSRARAGAQAAWRDCVQRALAEAMKWWRRSGA